MQTAAPTQGITGAVLCGAVVGMLGGIGASFLGVAGGELLIPTLVLLFGVDLSSLAAFPLL